MPQGRSAEYGTVGYRKEPRPVALCWWTWASMVSLGGGSPGAGADGGRDPEPPGGLRQGVWLATAGRQQRGCSQPRGSGAPGFGGG